MYIVVKFKHNSLIGFVFIAKTITGAFLKSLSVSINPVLDDMRSAAFHITPHEQTQ